LGGRTTTKKEGGTRCHTFKKREGKKGIRTSREKRKRTKNIGSMMISKRTRVQSPAQSRNIKKGKKACARPFSLPRIREKGGRKREGIRKPRSINYIKENTVSDEKHPSQGKGRKVDVGVFQVTYEKKKKEKKAKSQGRKTQGGGRLSATPGKEQHTLGGEKKEKKKATLFWEKKLAEGGGKGGGGRYRRKEKGRKNRTRVIRTIWSW